MTNERPPHSSPPPPPPEQRTQPPDSIQDSLAECQRGVTSRLAELGIDDQG